MRDRVETRLQDLRTELAVGERRLRELEAEQARVRETLLRIDGAILALDELLADGANELPAMDGAAAYAHRDAG